MKLPKCCRSDNEDQDEFGDRGSHAPCKSRSSTDGKYCEIDAEGKKACRNLSSYECQLEDQVETLQNALFTLSSHYAKIQFRLRQITSANSCERQRLLRELEYTISKGIDGQREGEELPCLISDARMMGDARTKQRKIITDLRNKLVDLSQSASLCFDTDEGGCYNFNNRRSYRIRYEYDDENADCEGDDDEYYEPKHGVGCMCCDCNSRYAPNYPTCSCRKAAADKFREDMEFDFSRRPKVNQAKDARERGYLPETWIPNDCICSCDKKDKQDDEDDENFDEQTRKHNGKHRKKSKKRRGKSKEGKRDKVDEDDNKKSNGPMNNRLNSTCTCSWAEERNEHEKGQRKGKSKRSKSISRNRRSSKASRKSIDSSYERAAAYLNYYQPDQNNRHSLRDRNGGIKNREFDNGTLVKCRCNSDSPYEFREYERDSIVTSPDQTDSNNRSRSICSEDCRGIPLTDSPHHPLHDARCQCCMCKNRVAQDLVSDSDERTSVLFEQIRKYDRVPNPIGIEDSDFYSDEQIEKLEKLRSAHITNPIGIEDSYAYEDEQAEKAERKQLKSEMEKAKSQSDSDSQRKAEKKKNEKSPDKSENKFKKDIERSTASDRSKRSNNSKRSSRDEDEQQIRNPLGIVPTDSQDISESDEKNKRFNCMKGRRSENSMINNLLVKKVSNHRLSADSDKISQPHKKRLSDEQPKKRFSDEQPKKRLSDEQPKKRLSDEQPKKRLSDEQPKKRLSDEQPKKPLSDEQPNKRLSDEQPKKRLSDEQPKKRLPNEQPKKVDSFEHLQHHLSAHRLADLEHKSKPEEKRTLKSRLKDITCMSKSTNQPTKSAKQRQTTFDDSSDSDEEVVKPKKSCLKNRCRKNNSEEDTLTPHKRLS